MAFLYQKPPARHTSTALAATFFIASLASLQAHAQSTAPVQNPVQAVTPAPMAMPSPQAPPNSLKAITVSERSTSPSADVTGFGDTPLARTPISASVIGSQQIEATGARRLADLLQQDASVSDAYNAVGYIDYVTMRGFVLDNNYNYRREGMPINANTAIALDNKESVELLKGTSGIQAGTSAPGGLVNYTVKRPTNTELRSARLETHSNGGLLLATDLGGHFGTEQQVGWRFNAASESLRTATPDTAGSRRLLALAMDLRISKDALLQAELEYSSRSQPSVPGLSLLGNTLPAPNPQLNLASNQAWAQPVVLQGLTGSLRFEQALSGGWRWSAQAATQRLKSDDRSAFPFGCSSDPSGNYVGDRYCANGDFDLYQFKSDGERRNTNALQLQLKGSAEALGVKHDLSLGLLSSLHAERFGLQAYNYVGTSNVNNLQSFAPDPTGADLSTNRTERSTELSATDSIRWTPRLSTWLGLRSTRLQRDSAKTDGSAPTSYSATLTTPWLAASYQLDPARMVYASYGQGVESQVVPNRPDLYSNAGVPLPALQSTQWELGIKSSSIASEGRLQWSAAYFHTVRPMSNLNACSSLCTGAYDGQALHQGLETSAQWAQGAWTLGSGLTLLHAVREGSLLEPQNNGLRPVNVPNWIARLQAGYRVSALPGLQLTGSLSHEGNRAVLPDQSIMLPAWTRLDAGLHYPSTLAGYKANWTLGIDNLLDARYFRESPSSYGHVYLFPAAPRTFRLGIQVNL